MLFFQSAETAEVSETCKIQVALERAIALLGKVRIEVHKQKAQNKLGSVISLGGSQPRDFGLSCTGLTLLKALLGHSSFSRSRGGVLHASCLTIGRSASSSFTRTMSMAAACFEMPFACKAWPCL